MDRASPRSASGMFQTGSHEICGSVAARTFRAVVTTSMFMIWSGIPLLLVATAEQRGPGRSQGDIAAFVTIDDDGRADRDAHLVGAARHVEQHQEILAEPSLAEGGEPGRGRHASRPAAGVGGSARSGERRTASSARLTCCGRVADVAERRVPREIRNGGASDLPIERPARPVRTPRPRGVAGVARAMSTAKRPARVQERRLGDGARGQILIERGKAGSEAPASRRLDWRIWVADGRELEVDERSRVVRIGRIVGERGRVGPLDEAGQRLLRRPRSRPPPTRAGTPCTTRRRDPGASADSDRCRASAREGLE